MRLRNLVVAVPFLLAALLVSCSDPLAPAPSTDPAVTPQFAQAQCTAHFTQGITETCDDVTAWNLCEEHMPGATVYLASCSDHWLPLGFHTIDIYCEYSDGCGSGSSGGGSGGGGGGGFLPAGTGADPSCSSGL